MRTSRGVVLMLTLGTLLAVVPAALSRSTGELIRPTSASGRCTSVGWIAGLTARAPRASLVLAKASKSCSCRLKPCAKPRRNQILFADERMSSGGGRFTFKSAATGAPTLTCIMSNRTVGVLFPSTVKFQSRIDHVVLKIVRGATSCQVGQGSAENGNANAMFIVGNTTRIEVGIVNDPVFGVKTTEQGALIQVRKGVVQVAKTTGQSASKNVGRDQQLTVRGHGNSLGTVEPLVLDAALRPGLCALDPRIDLTDVVTASGAHRSGNPLALAPDRNGNLWFTDDATPAIGRFNLATGKITYPAFVRLKPGSLPTFITNDTAGNVWFTDPGRTPAIGKIDPSARTLTRYDLTPGSKPWAPAYDPVNDLLWFTDQRKPTGAIGVIDPITGTITEVSDGLRHGSHPEGIAIDARGNAWFTDDNDPSPAIGVVDAKTHAIHEYSNGLVAGSLPRAITIAPGGAVWFSDERTVNNKKRNAKGDGLIGTISSTDPTHKIVEYAVEANGGNRYSIPEGIAWYNGFVWFTDDGVTKAIGRVDARTGAIAESSKALVARSKPIGVLVTKGALWFTDRLANSPKIGKLVTKPSC